MAAPTKAQLATARDFLARAGPSQSRFERGYVQLAPPFRWLRSVVVDRRAIEVEIDLLAPATLRKTNETWVRPPSSMSDFDIHSAKA